MSEEQKNPEIQHKPTTSFLNGVFLGTIVGAGAFFLLGTKKGKESRKKLLEKGKKAISFLEDAFEEVEGKGEELKPKAKKLTKELKKQSLKVGKKTSKTLTRLKKQFFIRKGRKVS